MLYFNPQNFLVLVVDDTRQNLHFVTEVLEQAGYRTVTARNGQQAINSVKTYSPDLILLDLIMPIMSGLKACEILKKNEHSSEIPVIFLTASNEENHLVEAFQAGAVDYLTKPFKTPELLARVRTHLELKASREALKRNLEELTKAYQEIEKLANTDPLTGIANRRYLFEELEGELIRSKRFNHPFSVLVLDIDHFKKINDTYGHDVGDEVIKGLVDTLNQSLREVDCLGRLGGEEFVIILPETSTEGALLVAERLRRLVSGFTLDYKQKEIISITVSIGISSYCKEDLCVETILKRADEALYKAKQEGRDRIVINSFTE